MDRPAEHAYLELADGIGFEVDVDLFDWPDVRGASGVWTAIVGDGPVMPEGTRGTMHLDAESPSAGHPYVVVLSAGRVSQLSGNLHADGDQ